MDEFVDFVVVIDFPSPWFYRNLSIMLATKARACKGAGQK
jgi:hypothetical protein